MSVSSFLALCQKDLVPRRELPKRITCSANLPSGNCCNQMFNSWIDVGNPSPMFFFTKKDVVA